MKKNPKDPLLCKVHVELEEDPTKLGDGEVPVAELILKIVMEGERRVEPMNLRGLRTPQKPKAENKKEFAIQLTRNKAAVKNYAFVLTNKNVNGSGGHDHINARPDGTQEQRRDNYGYYILKRTNDTIDVRPHQGSTQEDGREIFNYVASVFGDRMLLKAETTEPNKKPFLWDTLSLAEKVLGLVLLEGGTDYTLIGGTCEHHGPGGPTGCTTPNNNHWAEPTVIGDLQTIAARYHEEFPDDPILKINDISLPYGGRFDINGRWQGNSFHQYHRFGMDVDIQRRWAIPSENEERFETICIESGVIDPDPENAAHYHLYFWDRNQ